MNRFFVLILLALGCVSCAPESLSPQEYLAWMENPNNGLRSARSIGDYHFSLLMEPAEYLALRNQDMNNIDTLAFKQEVSEFRNLFHLQLSINTQNQETSILKHKIVNRMDYQERLEFFSIKAKNHIKLQTPNGEIRPVMVHFDHFFDLSPETKMLMTFEHIPEDQQEITFVLDDQVLGLGPVKIAINPSLIHNTPTLKIP